MVAGGGGVSKHPQVKPLHITITVHHKPSSFTGRPHQPIGRCRVFVVVAEVRRSPRHRRRRPAGRSVGHHAGGRGTGGRAHGPGRHASAALLRPLGQWRPEVVQKSATDSGKQWRRAARTVVIQWRRFSFHQTERRNRVTRLNNFNRFDHDQNYPIPSRPNPHLLKSLCISILKKN